MPSWAVAVLAIVIFFLVVFLRERRRGGAIEGWCQAHGFQQSERTAEERTALKALAMRFRPANVEQWGHLLRRSDAGGDVLIAEHAEKPTNSAQRWFTVIAIRVPGARFDAVRIVAAPSGMLRSATDALMAPGVAAENAVATRLGIEVTRPPAVYPVGTGKWAVEAEDPFDRAFWTSDKQATAIDAWPHDDCALAAIDDYVLVRVPGLIAVDRLDALLQRAADARLLFEQAAAARGREPRDRTS